ncbi:MAG: biopolymer transporter ExbD [Myxococcaceae bacterium]|nr:biopolymer transporter ExbD [Myxococcaceae bacterium]
MRPSPRSRPQVAAEAEELTIIPYLDILMNLILFMLLSMTGLALTRVVNARASTSSEGATASAVLTIAIDEDGFRLGSGDGATWVPRLRGAWDFEGLQRAASAHRQDGARQVVLRATPATPFELLIQTMDAVRSGPDGAALLPDVTLAPP